jgi:general secretion pathway protein K
MLVVAVATIVATNLYWRSALDQRRTGAALAADQGLLLLQGAEAWAGDILREDIQSSGPNSDHFGEIWAIELPPLTVDGEGTISGGMADLQGRFNLNNLIGPDGETDPIVLAQFERLLAALELDPSFASIVADWLDLDADPGFPNGGEDEVYSAAEPPYHTPNLAITSISELQAMSGMDQDTYFVLAPHLAVLPSGTKINVNTASAAVIASLGELVGLTQLVEDRGGADFVDVQDTFQGLVEPEMLQRIDGVSEYFQLRGRISIGTTQYTMYSLLHRDASGVVRSLFRSLGSE